MKCKKCGSTEFGVRGHRKNKFATKTKYQCKKCGKYHSETKTYRAARILLLDIETLPMEVYVWRPLTKYIPHDNVIKDYSIVCWAAKWLFDSEIMGQVVTPAEAVERSDASILRGIWDLIDQADMVITQNGIAFDMKNLNARFIKANYPPPSDYLNIDTKVTAHNVFGFSYNRLDYLAKFLLGYDGKEKMEFQDWIDCAQGKPEALAKMLHYCKKDVAPLMEDLYLKLRPWMRNHPNLNLFNDTKIDLCRNCGSANLLPGRRYQTPMGLWRGWRCGDCGATGRVMGKRNKIRGTRIK